MAEAAEHEYEQSWIRRDHHRIGVQRYPHRENHQDDRGDGPLLLLVPGMGVPAGYYRPFVRALRQHGVRVAAMDLRGTGTSQPTPARGDHYGYADLASDLGAVLDHLVPDSTTERVVLLGHSLGGQLCLLHQATTEDKRVAGTALIASAFAYWRAFPGWRRVAMRPFTRAVDATASLLGVWPGWGFGGRQSSGVMHDWARTSRTGWPPSLDGSDTRAALGAIRTPVLAASVEDDRYAPAPTVDQLCGLLESAPLERAHFSRTSVGQLGHFRWARDPGSITDRVVGFASAVLGDGRAC